MPPRTWSRSNAAALVTAVVLLVACGAASAPVRSLDPNADVVVPYAIAGGGEVRFTVRPRYVIGGERVVSVFTPSDPYSLSLEFIVGDDVVRLGSVIEMRAP